MCLATWQELTVAHVTCSLVLTAIAGSELQQLHMHCQE